jgi:hypothetical protein
VIPPSRRDEVAHTTCAPGGPEKSHRLAQRDPLARDGVRRVEIAGDRVSRREVAREVALGVLEATGLDEDLAAIEMRDGLPRVSHLVPRSMSAQVMGERA